MIETGSVIDGKYKILSVIGRGGMSVVYMAINERANKPWAVKEVRRSGVRDFEIVRQGLITETEFLKKLSHPNLPSIVDVIDSDQSLLIVMDYIEGYPLSRALREQGTLPQERVIEWAKQLCDVLGYLHSRTPAIIYRDMKPSNVMLRPDGNVTLIDFGTAREFKSSRPADTMCLGTAGYAAPEQFGGYGQTDARTDIYCLGATMHHLLTGIDPSRPPFERLPLREVDPSLSAGLEHVVERCTQQNPLDRYQSCAELMYALDHYHEQDGQFKKKQARRLTVFACALVATLSMATVSAVSRSAAERRLADNYGLMLAAAEDARLAQNERTDIYLGAIAACPQLPDAYLSLIDSFLGSGGDAGAGALTREESSVITRLQAGIDISGRDGAMSTVYPLDALRQKNTEGYDSVCYELGMAYWYDYEVEASRYSSAAWWLGQVSENYPAARIYVEIDKCLRLIDKYSGQNRTEKMFIEYESLWRSLLELADSAASSGESDIKLLVSGEVVRLVSDRADYLIPEVVSARDAHALFDAIESDITLLRGASRYQDIKTGATGILEAVAVARARADAVLERDS
ncbi:MAG: serine/threonine protein kinase [Oscillospiraceae bacterium]|jgi:serine/threonine-protein kinase|nr:serine/threonine protein kinase [Oscillospiraceae bacterium]